MGRYFFQKFEDMPINRQSWTIVGLALAGANPMTFLFYGLFFHDRLVLDLVFTSIIVVMVGWPIAYIFLRQQAEMKSMTGQLKWAAHFDDLTKLTNRRTFIEQSDALIKSAGPRRSAGGLLYIDVDRFKSINDTFGHAAGDRVLEALAAAIRKCIRDADLAGRLGGEEFAVLLVRAEREQAKRVAERIRLSVRDVTGVIGIEDREITISIGLAMHHPGQSLDETLSQADRFLYVAKERGRNQVVDDSVLAEAA